MSFFFHSSRSSFASTISFSRVSIFFFSALISSSRAEGGGAEGGEEEDEEEDEEDDDMEEEDGEEEEEEGDDDFRSSFPRFEDDIVSFVFVNGKEGEGMEEQEGRRGGRRAGESWTILFISMQRTKSN